MEPKTTIYSEIRKDEVISALTRLTVCRFDHRQWSLYDAYVLECLAKEIRRGYEDDKKRPSERLGPDGPQGGVAPDND